MVLIRRASRIDERDTVEDVEEWMVRLTEYDAVNLLSKYVLGLLCVRGKLSDRSDIVSDSDSEAIQIIHAHVGKGSEIELKVVSPNRQNRTVTLAETFQHMIALQIAGVDDDIRVFDNLHNVLRNGIRALPVSVGKDCNSHIGISSFACMAPKLCPDYSTAIDALRGVSQWPG